MLDVVRPAQQPVPTTPAEYQGVVCLGGGMGAYDDSEHPWLAEVRKLLSASVAQRVPVLAVCLGAQLLAVATGGQVRKGPRGPEAGPSLVAKRDAAGRDPLFADLPLLPDVIQFHEDEVHVLPPAAEHLAASPTYQHQAFRVGSSAYGIQFHIETTPEIVAEWARRNPARVAAARPGAFELERLRESHQDVAETWQPFAERFVRLAAGELVPAAPTGRDLPLV
ncbi:GMP synthase - Glutamine amidotransferase [Goodfellowiella coeruleoviolacea]|uniref:GMP synthase - Glutamine amidotransferase n=1 Tax=Goodfellowiella coeruleoviolacea TaxID=334858 RepID=A0AAE3KHX9_9PSEU|nr:GMP synthase - Glutamine amidotransferase [Goodfellowiella coeruleoviolacea]